MALPNQSAALLPMCAHSDGHWAESPALPVSRSQVMLAKSADASTGITGVVTS